ncbi:unnamed protein product [Mucor hiemalis]
MQNHQRSSFLRFPTSNQQIKKPTASTPLNISFNCLHSDLEICGKAERAFKKVGKMISDVILFKEPVRVNATLTSFCETANECGEHMMTLGGSSPARSMPLLNSDGVLRLHPQALVKQFGLPDNPAFSPFDILSVFNADAPFWFEEDGVPIGSNQADFSFVILHEFMHGLGFYSGWNEYVAAQALTPDPSPFLANQVVLLVNPNTNAIHPNQFIESAMDRLIKIIKLNNNSVSIPISEYTKKLNRIQASSLAELVTNPGFDEAKEMGKISTEPESMVIELDSEENEPIVLETSLRPFQPGSSISHVSYANYTHTPDFLMRFMQDRGLSLEEAVKRGGGNGPIGPLLLRVMEEIGLDQEMSDANSTAQHGIRRKSQHHRPVLEYSSFGTKNLPKTYPNLSFLFFFIPFFAFV